MWWHLGPTWIMQNKLPSLYPEFIQICKDPLSQGSRFTGSRDQDMDILEKIAFQSHSDYFYHKGDDHSTTSFGWHNNMSWSFFQICLHRVTYLLLHNSSQWEYTVISLLVTLQEEYLDHLQTLLQQSAPHWKHNTWSSGEMVRFSLEQTPRGKAVGSHSLVMLTFYYHL